VAYNAPHYPLQAKEADARKYWNAYDVRSDVIREGCYEKIRRLGVIAKDTLLSPRPENVPAWADLSEAQRKERRLTMAAYAGMVDCVDQNLGRLIGRLKEMGRWENTLFLFLSVNGACPFQRTQHAGVGRCHPKVGPCR